MSDPADSRDGVPQASAAEPGAGVLGNLPRSRPSVRSPRRPDKTTEAKAAESPSAGAGADGPRHDEPGGDLEALARGGLTIAGGMASLGLKVAGRAAGAVRDAIERR